MSLRSLLLALLIAIVAAARVASDDCADDCNADQRVTIDELVEGVRIALGEEPVATCPAADSKHARVTPLP